MSSLDDGIYSFLGKHRMHITFHNALWDTLSALYRVQPSSCNIQTLLHNGTHTLFGVLYRVKGDRADFFLEL